MNAGPDRTTPQGDDLDPRHDAVWRLLERAPLPEPDVWFAARTLARCRSERPVRVGVWRSLLRWSLGCGIAVCGAVALVTTQIQSDKVETQKHVQEAFEVVASVDYADTDSSASSTSWSDSSL
jgi:hypothetical protein